MDVEELAARMSQALELGTWREAVRLLHGLHPADVADLMGHLSPAQRRVLFSLLDPEVASEVILHLDKETRKSILSQLTRDRLSALIEEMATDDAADVVAELPPEEVKEVLREIARLDRQESEAIEELLRYAPESAGGLMEPEVLALRSEATAGQALAELRRRRELEDVHNLFVIDAEGRPVGMVPLQRLVTADPGQSVASLMEPLPAVARVDMDQEEVARLAKVLYARKAELEKVLKAHLEENDELVLGGVRYRMFNTTKVEHPLNETIDLLGKATGMSWDELVGRIAVVDNKALERLLKEVGKKLDRSRVTLLKAELDATARKSFSPRFWAKEVQAYDTPTGEALRTAFERKLFST